MNGIEIEIEECEDEWDKARKCSREPAAVSLSTNAKIEEFNSDNFLAKQLDYQENYLMGDLKKIADYYDINCRKLKKEQVIQEIVLFESDPNNTDVFFKRLQAWYWLKELKEDPKLKQFILF
jgi:hypothetical protein